jgi:hypothetical protein
VLGQLAKPSRFNTHCMERMLVHLLGSFFFTIWSRLEQKPTEQRSQINISRVQSTSWSIFYAVKDCGFHICCITGAELVASWRMHLRDVKGVISFWFHCNSQRSRDSASGVVCDDAIVYTRNLQVTNSNFRCWIWTVPLRDSEQVKGIFRPVFKH